MKKAFVLVMVLGSFGCNYAPDGTRELEPTEQDIVIDTIDRWDAWARQTEGYEPVSDSCYQDLMEIGVYVAHTHEEMLAAAGRCGPDDTDPWNYFRLDEPFDDGKACPSNEHQILGQARTDYADWDRVIIMAAGADWCETFPHEILHHLAGCMGYGSDGEHISEFWPGLDLEPGGFEHSQGPETPGWPGCR